MSRLQLALNVHDIESAVEFYSTLFETPPAKRRPGYANFSIAEPPLKLVLIENPSETGTLNHLGVERESTQEVQAQADRLDSAGGAGGERRGVLLRPPGQALGGRPGRPVMGELRRASRRPARARGPDDRGLFVVEAGRATGTGGCCGTLDGSATEPADGCCS
jgi:catechol 2,3-dioxygenase-like lactoylglutathione lyase family enzyme